MADATVQNYSDWVLDVIGKLEQAGIQYTVDIAIVDPARQLTIVDKLMPPPPGFLHVSSSNVHEVDFKKIEERVADEVAPMTQEEIDRALENLDITGVKVTNDDPITEDDEDDDLSFLDDVSDSDPTPTTSNPAPEPEEQEEPAVIHEPLVSDDDDEEFADLYPVPPVEETAPYLDAENVLKFNQHDFPSAKQGAEAIHVQMFYTSSTNVSAIGAKERTDPQMCTVYIRFKTGNTIYRYNPVKLSLYHELLGEAVRAERGIKEASVGSMYHHMLKVPADENKIKCQRLRDDNIWETVLPKSQRVKAVKEKAKQE